MARGRALARRVSSNTDPGLGARYDHLRFLSIVFRLHVGEKLLQQHLDQRLLDRWRRRLTAFAGLNLDDDHALGQVHNSAGWKDLAKRNSTKTSSSAARSSRNT